MALTVEDQNQLLDAACELGKAAEIMNRQAIRIARLEAVVRQTIGFIENMRVVPGGVRDRLLQKLRASLE